MPALKNKGLLNSYPSRDSLAKIWSYIGHEKKPSHAVSIRAIEAEKYKVVDKTSNEVLEEIEESKAFFQGSNEIFDTVDLLLPNYSHESQAVWIRVPQSIKRKVKIQNFSFCGGLHAACHALLNVVPL
ncbi:hypothetical protein GIB67_015711 [Kingdonia uniflora]|uniref:Uncharacterized protein n=1 Tax=Kingdonia uniflora TaxID=39325 RepID=A0A7J7NUC1_9MAGN|nr:hypothetical protein GIB67_015711 [Kingdonia uniflora]